MKMLSLHICKEHKDDVLKDLVFHIQTGWAIMKIILLFLHTRLLHLFIVLHGLLSEKSESILIERQNSDAST